MLFCADSDGIGTFCGSLNQNLIPPQQAHFILPLLKILDLNEVIIKLHRAIGNSKTRNTKIFFMETQIF